MKELRIYQVRSDNKSYLLRSTRVSASFVGIGATGRIIMSELKALAEFLEPNLNKIHIEVIDL